MVAHGVCMGLIIAYRQQSAAPSGAEFSPARPSFRGSRSTPTHRGNLYRLREHFCRAAGGNDFDFCATSAFAKSTMPALSETDIRAREMGLRDDFRKLTCGVNLGWVR